MNRISIFIIAMVGTIVPTIVSCTKTDIIKCPEYSTSWQPDILRDGYEMRYVSQENDYSGAIRSTIIRKRSECGKNRGILYVHGFNDYFFQAEMGDRFVDSCYNFYAVDLRKYGRSIIPGQKLFQVRDIKEYFPDIDSALVQMNRDGIDEVILMGHSTGGLSTSLFMNYEPDTIVKALILNSPFLDWNLNPLVEKILVPAVSITGKIFPNIKIRQDHSREYSESLLKKYRGEWNYNTSWKQETSPDVDTGWIRAIEEAQEMLHNNSYITVPILLLHSDSSYVKGDNPQKTHLSDIVLDVADISKYGRLLGNQVTEVTISGGLHDLVLSKKEVRDSMYSVIFEWLDSNEL